MNTPVSRSRIRGLLTPKARAGSGTPTAAAYEKSDTGSADFTPADSFTADSVRDLTPVSGVSHNLPPRCKVPQGGARAFVAALTRKAETRRHLAQLLGEYCLVEGGDRQIANWIKDEGFDVTIPSILQALDEARAKDLLFWSSRYHLFVLWSANGEHPWDTLPAAEVATATLEIGSRRGSEGSQVVVLLNGRAINSYTFDNCVFRTTVPVDWETPDGQVAKVNLHLQMSAFSGYGKKEEQNAYLGLQTHGVLWPADMSNVPSMWPITPPIVAGKVNVAARVAAIAPGKIDSLAAFEGTYNTHYVSDLEGAPSKTGPLLSIKVTGGHPTVTLDGKTVACWTFVANNVLAWEDDAGYSAWLQFVVLPGGPVFMGDLHPHDDQKENTSSGGFNVFGELQGQPSRLSPDMQMDSTVGQLVASGLATAGTLLCTSLLRNAHRCWQLIKSGQTDDAIAAEHDELLRLMENDFSALAHFQAVGAATESTFPWGPEVKEMDPDATLKATTAQAEAAENATAAKAAASAAEEALSAVETAEDVVEATSKAAVAAWRSNQAAASAAAAEVCALAAAHEARSARTSAALVASMGAAQSFNQAKDSAYEAAKAGAKAAQAALEAVEHNVNVYVQRKDYLKLKDIAEASDIAGKALLASKQAVAGWEAGSAATRQTSVTAANEAADYAQLCHKVLRAVHRE